MLAITRSYFALILILSNSSLVYPSNENVKQSYGGLRRFPQYDNALEANSGYNHAGQSSNTKVKSTNINNSGARVTENQADKNAIYDNLVAYSNNQMSQSCGQKVYNDPSQRSSVEYLSQTKPDKQSSKPKSQSRKN